MMQNTVLVANFEKKKNQTWVMFLDKGNGLQGILHLKQACVAGASPI